MGGPLALPSVGSMDTSTGTSTGTKARVSPVALVLVAAYALVIAYLTLTDASRGAWAFSLADRAATRLSDGALTWSETEVLANVALFVPFGFLLAIGLGRVWPAVTLCLMTSAAIEWVQYAALPSRVPTLDDVVHNTVGGLVGALAAGVLLLATSAPTHGATPGVSARR